MEEQFCPNKGVFLSMGAWVGAKPTTTLLGDSV